MRRGVGDAEVPPVPRGAVPAGHAARFNADSQTGSKVMVLCFKF